MINTYSLLKVEDNILLKIEFTQAQNADTLLPIVESSRLNMTKGTSPAKYADFAERLNTLMKNPASPIKTVRELQNIAGVSYEMARRYTLGAAKPRDEKLEKIAVGFGVQPSYLDHGTGDMHPSQYQSMGDMVQSQPGQSQSQNQQDQPSKPLSELIETLKVLDSKNELSSELISTLKSMVDVATSSNKDK